MSRLEIPRNRRGAPFVLSFGPWGKGRHGAFGTRGRSPPRRERPGVRGQIARGEIPAVKRDGRWLVDRGRLPLTEGQRRTLQVKADSVREAVEQALPSRMARTAGQRARSLVDLDAFRLGAELLFEMRKDEPGPPPALRLESAALLEEALLSLAEAVQLFERQSEQVDGAIVRLRTLLRLGRDLDLVSAGGLRFAGERLQAIGRMTGGWRKRVETSEHRAERRVTGDGPPAAGGA